MKGFPLRDVLLILVGSLLFALPLWRLTRPAPPPPAPASSSETAEKMETETWVEFRFSHAPERLRIFQSGKLLHEGGGALREDADLLLDLSEPRKPLELEFRWPEEVMQAWVEVNLEAGGRPRRQLGFWARGELTRNWIPEWEEPL